MSEHPRLDELFADQNVRMEVREIATLLHLTTDRVYKWLNDGTMPGYRIGGGWFVMRDEIRDWLASQSNQIPGNTGHTADLDNLDDD